MNPHDWIFDHPYGAVQGLAVAVGFPGRGDDVGLFGAADEGGGHQGEFAEFVVDRVDGLVQAVAFFINRAEQIRLGVLGA